MTVDVDVRWPCPRRLGVTCVRDGGEYLPLVFELPDLGLPVLMGLGLGLTVTLRGWGDWTATSCVDVVLTLTLGLVPDVRVVCACPELPCAREGGAPDLGFDPCPCRVVVWWVGVRW